MDEIAIKREALLKLVQDMRDGINDVTGYAWAPRCDITASPMAIEKYALAMYPPEKWRTSAKDCDGYQYQVRDGIVWWRTDRSGPTWKRHTPVMEMIAAIGDSRTNSFEQKINRITTLIDVALKPEK